MGDYHGAMRLAGVTQRRLTVKEHTVLHQHGAYDKFPVLRSQRPISYETQEQIIDFVNEVLNHG